VRILELVKLIRDVQKNNPYQLYKNSQESFSKRIPEKTAKQVWNECCEEILERVVVYGID